MRIVPRLTLALALALLAAPAASARPTGRVADRTLSCTVGTDFDVSAWATDPRIHTAGIEIGTDHRSTVLFALDTAHPKPTIAGSSCRTVRTSVPLRRAGLPLDGTFRAGGFTSFDGHCPFGGRVLIRLRLDLTASGKPLRGQLAVARPGKKGLRPLAFVRWAPSRTTGYLSSLCTDDG